MTLQQFVDKYNGKKWDFDNAYSAQCVDLFRFYNKEVLEISQPRGVAGAKDFWSNYDSDPILRDNFEKIPNTPEFIPNPGDVMIWNGWYGPYGHIAIVTRADINKFTALSQNDPTGRETHLKEYTYSKVYGVLRPKVLSTGDTMPGTVTQEEYDKVRLERDANHVEKESIKKEFQEFVKTIIETLEPNSPISDVDKSLAITLARNIVDENSKLQSEFSKAQKEWAKQEKALEEENLELEKQVSSLKQEVERLLKRVEQVETDLANQKKEKAQSKAFGDFLQRILDLFKKG